MTEKLPPELQTQLGKFQQLKDQLDKLLQEKAVVEGELKEINKVLEELSSLPADATLYKIVGNIFVKTEKAKVESELNDRKDLLELRSKAYQKQEGLLRKQLEDLQSKINDMLSRYYPQSGGGVTKA
ncbi:prefoldin subunit beta [Sulfuracidifex tepidarius]|uniref:Prefoldin subunit beta n=1 Tax=Sulfuracidifex tepidarius TaxID=1294262 RepID=A0A510DW07_9CREN|nr:prefoldin subunit beta [Sulfuracidifex tepidarius]BBG24411.1 Prefoldin subunit beta [Sulfuracidifex tepidarius]BBG27169.1 Prefoldin subunit beta [Sulfuracidifex tepidarius]